uniref:Putative nitrite reductase NirV n=1 Tax=uncultured bacterium 1042 TaxID=548897 RepID=B8R8T1_9BACT|nr:putative nitrite reductase NirV [uncultured bacterium 1042]
MTITALKVASSLAAAALVPAGLAGSMQPNGGSGDIRALPGVATVLVLPGPITYPPPGEFLRGGLPEAAVPRRLVIGEPFEIMTYQVSSAEYALCVDAGACRPAGERPNASGERPVTGVSYLDADAYARWYSHTTGESWRLPTDPEWALAAAERFVGGIEGVVDDPKNPARRWLSNYAAEAGAKRQPDPLPRMRGSFGVNSLGVKDLSGNVWEWTSTCYARSSLAGDRSVLSTVENCGVHVLEGVHRAYMSNFVSDGRSGGCAVGTPPDNLGFRLVRDRIGSAKTL